MKAHVKALREAAWAARILRTRDTLIECARLAVVDVPVHDLHKHEEREARARLGPDL